MSNTGTKYTVCRQCRKCKAEQWLPETGEKVKFTLRIMKSTSRKTSISLRTVDGVIESINEGIIHAKYRDKTYKGVVSNFAPASGANGLTAEFVGMCECSIIKKGHS